MIKTLHRRESELARAKNQVEILSGEKGHATHLESFQSKLEKQNLFPLNPTDIEILQINVGKMCNQVCKHCHVDAGPDRKEIMTRETMQLCLDAVKSSSVKTVDLTGGAPEMNPNFRWFVEELSKLNVEIIVRCNLTIIVANPKYNDLPDFFAKHKVQVVSSLPSFTARRTDAQRGEGVFEKSIKALKMLNSVGYGLKGSNLELHLVYNPTGAYLPGDQTTLELDYKRKLGKEYGISFHNLFAITNIPVSRFLDYLLASKKYEDYLEELVNAYNPAAAQGVMCRNTVSVGWDGGLYDCDFNQMLELSVEDSAPQHISNFNLTALKNRNIIINQHCFGCTAGSGSSCGGQTA
jgi:radical SAM/Cys-rich protein